MRLIVTNHSGSSAAWSDQSITNVTFASIPDGRTTTAIINPDLVSWDTDDSGVFILRAQLANGATNGLLVSGSAANTEQNYNLNTTDIAPDFTVTLLDERQNVIVKVTGAA